MKKKLIALVLAVLAIVMCGCLAACGGGDKDTTESTTEPSTTAAADSELAEIKAKGKLVIGMTEYPPMNFRDADGKWTGFDTEFALAVGEKLDVEVEFIEISWDNRFIELKAKDIDCIWNGMTINDDARKNASISTPYVKNAQVVVMKKDKIASFADKESMKDLTFVAEAGSAGEKEIQKAGFENYIAVETQTDAVLQVEAGKADACVIDLTMADAITKEGGSYEDLGYSVELSTEEYGIAFRMDSDLTAAVDAIIEELREDGTLQALADKYELILA